MRKIRLIFVLMLLAGCTQLHPASMETATESALSPDRTEKVSHPAITQTSQPSPTHTITPTLGTDAPVLLTPKPPLISQKAFLEYIAITGDNICKLPCWLNITPGQTDWEDITLAVEPLAVMADMEIREAYGEKLNGVRWALFGENIRVEGTILNGNNADSIEMMVITSTSATTDAPSYSLPLPETFSMNNIFQEYGIPSMVFFSTELGAVEYPRVHLFIVLVYPEQHFAIRYNRIATVKGKVIESCVPSGSFYVLVVNSQEKLASLERMEQAPEMGQLTPLFLEPLEKTMDSSIEDFYKNYISSASECIHIPVDAWEYMLP